MNCPHLIPGPAGGGCVLNLYGGQRISEGTHLACIAKNQNNKEFADALFARAEISHPSTQPRVSGCCDSALN